MSDRHHEAAHAARSKSATISRDPGRIVALLTAARQSRNPRSHRKHCLAAAGTLRNRLLHRLGHVGRLPISTYEWPSTARWRSKCSPLNWSLQSRFDRVIQGRIGGGGEVWFTPTSSRFISLEKTAAAISSSCSMSTESRWLDRLPRRTGKTASGRDRGSCGTSRLAGLAVPTKQEWCTAISANLGIYLLVRRVPAGPLLADFGLGQIALVLSMESKTASGTIPGDVADYIAPEQGRGSGLSTVSSDLYSVGVVLYRVLSGRLPFAADNASAMIFQHVHEPPPPLAKTAPHVPAPLASLVEKLLLLSSRPVPDRRRSS